MTNKDDGQGEKEDKNVPGQTTILLVQKLLCSTIRTIFTSIFFDYDQRVFVPQSGF